MSEAESSPQPCRIVVADDHPLVRRAVAEAVRSVLAHADIVEVGRLAEAMDVIAAGPPVDLLVLDLNMPGMDGFVGLVRARSEHPAVPVIVISAEEEPAAIRRSLQLGASGYVPKSVPFEVIGEAIGAVLAGQVWTPSAPAGSKAAASQAPLDLTPQQRRVLQLLADGKLNKQIAFDMGITEATVKAHMTAIFRKLSVQSRTQAVIAARRLRLGDGA